MNEVTVFAVFSLVIVAFSWLMIHLRIWKYLPFAFPSFNMLANIEKRLDRNSPIFPHFEESTPNYKQEQTEATPAPITESYIQLVKDASGKAPNKPVLFYLQAGENLVGRAPQTNPGTTLIKLAQDKSISSEHALIRMCKDGNYELEDRSRHGTWINSKLVQKPQATCLQNGDMLRMGNSFFKFVQPGASSNSSTVPRWHIYNLQNPAQFWILENGSVTIGRGQTANWRINGDSNMSRLHARLTLDGKLVRLENISTTRPLWKNNNKVTGRVVLETGDKIKLSETELKVSFE